MRILPSWLRSMVSGSLPTLDQQLADELTLIGIAVEGMDRTGSETVFEMEITTNRVDAMNHHGIARECSALYDVDLKPLQPHVKASGGEQFPIKIAEPALCARYTSMILRDVNIKPSAGEIAERFAVLGQKPINNAADATNYTLLEMGHPTHVFDLDKLAGGTILVRMAKQGEKIRTLDGVERTLYPDDLVIADAEKPVAIAGVIGGEDTKVTEATRNILIESAWFDTATVRRTSKRHILHTDASHRFERGADFNATTVACQRVAELILAQAGGRAASGLIDVVERAIAIPPIELRLQQVQRILGKSIETAEIRRILTRLGFGLETLGNDNFRVSVPTWRLDVSREIDLIEEIARVHGFNRFENTLPAYSGGVVELPTAEREAKVRSTMLALGFHEALSSSFISREDAVRFSPYTKPVELENPLSEERAVMRTSLVPGMLDMLEHNLNRNQDEVRLFEMGNTFRADGQRVGQTQSLCLAVTQPESSSDWPRSPFFSLKGAVETILHEYEGTPEFAPTAPEVLRQGRSTTLALNGTVLGKAGEVTASAYGARKFKQPVYVCEVDLDALWSVPLRTGRYTPLSRYPAVERDFSFLVPNTTTWERVQRAIAARNVPNLAGFHIVEIFRGKSVPEGQYSALFRATLQSREHTLREEEAAQASAEIIAALQELGGALRSS